MKKIKVSLFISICILLLSSLAPVKAGSLDGACPDSDYFGGLIDKFCWSCVLPFNLMGFSDNVPDGGSTDSICSCKDDLGVPSFGASLGYWSPDFIVEVSVVPFCSPTLGGIQLQDDLTSMGSVDKKTKNSTRAQYHYNYFVNPIFKILGMFLVPDCDKDPGIVDLDLAYMSMLDITYYDDMLALVFNPESVAFSTPITQAICVKDCVIISATGDPASQNWFCAGCDGMLYPFTGNVARSSNMVRASHVIVTRALASLHRRGLAKETYGDEAMCSNVYSPMIPKPMYKLSMAFPNAEVNSWGGGTTMPLLSPQGEQVLKPDGSVLTHEVTQKCCHPLGDNVMKWGMGRTTPGGGKDNTAVYNVFRYNNCCIRPI